MNWQEAQDLAQKHLCTLSLPEKVGQMRLCSDLKELLHAVRSGKTLEAPYGFAFMPSGFSAEELNEIQSYFKNKTRAKIPLLIAGESIHGVMHPSGTVFPQSIALASSFNKELLGEVAGVIGQEAYAVGLRQTYAPNIDISRDPRWGRVQENYGEDPYLTAEMGEIYVRRLQAEGVAATLKHYIAHGAPERGLNLAPVHMGEREVREIALEPFAKCIAAGALTVMPAYSELDGEPLHASVRYLRNMLRGELNFKGVTVSDYGGIEMLHSFHRTAESAAQAGKQSLRAGVDVEAPTPFGYGDEFLRTLQKGDPELERIDEAVLRILALKYRLGLFSEAAYSDETVQKNCHTPEAVKLARRSAAESAVLLKNDGILPLKKTIKKIAVIGCNADNVVTGDYTYFPLNEENNVSLLRGIREKLGAERILYAKGCSISRASRRQIEEAVSVAEKSEVIVVGLGDNSNFFGGVGWGNKDGDTLVNCGEGFDVHDLDLPAAQRRLLRALKRTGKPIVCVLFTGRPQSIGREVELCNAVFQAWYLGEQGGNALADLLFGDAVPSGRLPISFPRNAGSLPCCYNHKPSSGGYYKKPGSPRSPGRDYVFESPEPLFPFGFGLSYTHFVYKNLCVVKKSGLHYAIHFEIENAGDYDAQETVLLFLACHYSETPPFVKRLRRFTKIMLEAGKTSELSFCLDRSDFTCIGTDMREVIASGKYTVMIGDLRADIDVSIEE